MKTIKKEVIYKINYKQYKDYDIYNYKITSTSLFIKRISGYTNKEGIDSLLNGKPDNIKNFNYVLLNKEELNLFREKSFFDAMNELRKNSKTLKNKIDDPEYDLYDIKTESHSILDLEGNLLPKFISLNNPLYLINNKDFNLEEVLKQISKDNRFKNTHEINRYEIIKDTKLGINISTIPYYNSDDYKNEYINVGLIPTDEDWEKIMSFVKENKLMDKKTGHISYLSQLVLELGILGFEIAEEKKFITKGLK